MDLCALGEYGPHIDPFEDGPIESLPSDRSTPRARWLCKATLAAMVLLTSCVAACSSNDDADGDSAQGSTSAGGSATSASNSTTGSSGQAGQSAGGTVPPVYERLDCDLPAVLEYCGGATCHYDNASQAVASDLVLWDRESQQVVDGVEASLLDVPASYHNVTDIDACPSEAELLVNTSDPEESLILKKLTGTQTCGDEMPKFPYPEWGATNNPGAQREALVACVRDWVMLLAED